MNFRDLIVFLGQFRRRGGLEVFSSGIGTKLAAFIVSIVVARLLPREDFGLFSYAVVIVYAMLPFAGGGMDITLLRYGAVAGEDSEKRALFQYTFRWGVLLSSGMAAGLFLLAKVICVRQPGSAVYLKILALFFLTEFMVRAVEAHLRVQMRNRRYASVEFVRSILLLAMVLILVPSLGAVGYASALVAVPFIVCMIFARDFSYIWRPTGGAFCCEKAELLRFGLLIGLGAIISQLQFSLDTIFLGNMMSDAEALAQYRVASLLAINIIFLPQVFFVTEYVHITKNHASRKFISDYLRRYTILALLASAVIIGVTQLFAEDIVVLAFGEKYLDSARVLKILVIGMSGALLLRQPYGNLLNASGKANLNVINAVFSTVSAGVLLFLLIPKFGVIGAALSTTIMMWLCGMMGAGMYFGLIFPKLR